VNCQCGWWRTCSRADRCLFLHPFFLFLFSSFQTPGRSLRNSARDATTTTSPRSPRSARFSTSPVVSPRGSFDLRLSQTFSPTSPRVARVPSIDGSTRFASPGPSPPTSGRLSLDGSGRFAVPTPSPPAAGGRRGNSVLPSSLRGSSSAELDLSASPEATLNLSFSPRSSGKLGSKIKRKSRKRNNHNNNNIGSSSNNNNNSNNNTSNTNNSGAGGGGSMKRSGSLERSLGEVVVSMTPKRAGASGVRFVLPVSLTEKAEKGLIDVTQWSKLEEQLKKVSRLEYKAIVKSTRAPRTWAEKLQTFPSATSYFAYAKNRYRDVLADEATRVKLQGMEHDYINANYIEGARLPGQPKVRYIATQAPLPATMEDFWWMVWQEKSCVIVMLTKLREKGTVKAHPYWPKHIDEEMEFGEKEKTKVFLFFYKRKKDRCESPW
jgi:hypothetical protein